MADTKHTLFNQFMKIQQEQLDLDEEKKEFEEFKKFTRAMQRDIIEKDLSIRNRIRHLQLK